MVRRACLVVLVAVLALPPAVLVAGAVRVVHAALQDPAAVPELDDGFPRDVDVAVLAAGLVEAQPAAPARLVLERLAVRPGPGEGLRPAAGPELLYVEHGVLLISDELGIEGAYPEGTYLFFGAGVPYGVRNDGSDDARLLRVTVVSSPSGATLPPADGTTPLLTGALGSLPAAPARLFLARTTWAPGADLGEQVFPGPVGFVGEAGVLTVAGRSGSDGQLAAGRATLFPAETTNRVRNRGDEPAEALMIGLIPVGVSLLPTPTPPPPSPPPPTATPVPTATPSPTLEPTATPAPTATRPPEPTPDLTTPAETILQSGETWRRQGTELTIAVDGDGDGVSIEGVVANRGRERLDFVIPADAIRVYDDLGGTWSPRQGIDDFVADRVILEPDDQKAYGIVFAAPLEDGRYSANVFVSVVGVGAVQRARWGFTYDGGRILTLPPGAVDPGEASSGAGSGAASESDPPVIRDADPPVTGGVSPDDLLPVAADVPAGLVVVDEGSRARDAITASFPDPVDAERRFQDWGWTQSVYRTYGRPEGSAFDQTDVSIVDVSAHEFGDAAGASAALHYFAEARAVIMGIAVASVESLGDESTAVAGLRVDGVNEAGVYVRRGRLVVRVSVVSPQGDPWDVARDVARTLAERQPGGAPVVVGRTESAPAAGALGLAEDPAYWAWYYSTLEANRAFDALYGYMHPDAQAVVSREAVVGWYQSAFYPSVSEIEVLDVTYVAWTWPVTGRSYSNTAEVTYTQTVWGANGEEQVTDVVRLVEACGQWRWFFGRSAEFVAEQTAFYGGQPETDADC